MRLIVFLIAACLFGQPPDPYLAAARKAEAAGDFAAAEREYGKAIAIHADAATYQRLGLVRHLQNKFTEAIAAFQQSLKLAPEQWACRLFLGIDLYRTNQFPRALIELKQADRLHPNDPDVHFWLGMTHLARQDYSTGLLILELASREQPNNLEILRVLAENYAAFGTSLLNHVAEKYPDTPAGLQVHAQALELEGANEAALEVYRRLEKLQPDRPGVKKAIERLRPNPSAPRPPSPPAAAGESPTPP